jgi:hypothetical protein
VSNDFIANYNLDFSDASDSDALALRGGFFFFAIAFLNKLIDSKFIILFLYILAPILHFKLFYQLLNKNINLCIFMYVGLIYLAQSTYLLKMSLSQILFMYALSKRGLIKKILISFCLLLHLQSAVVLLGFLSNIPRLLFVSILGIVVYWFNAQMSSLFLTFDFLSAYANLNDNAQIGFKDINSVSLILIILYLLISVNPINYKSSNSLILEKIIDSTLVLSLALIDNLVVMNRILDFSWLLIIIYIGVFKELTKKIFSLFFISTLFFFIWGINFLFSTII